MHAACKPRDDSLNGTTGQAKRGAYAKEKRRRFCAAVSRIRNQMASPSWLGRLRI